VKKRSSGPNRGKVLYKFHYGVVCFVFLFAMSAPAVTVDFTENLLADVPGDEAVEKRVFELVNEKRTENGLEPLTWDDRLSSAARHHLVEMAVLGYFTHESPTPGFEDVADRVYVTGLTDRTVGENLVVTNVYEKGDGLSDAFVELWVESPEHKSELLNGSYNYTGVGVHKSGDNYYCAQIFSRRRLDFEELTLTDDGSGIYIVSGKGRLIGGGDALRLADGGDLTEFDVKKSRFSFEYPVAVGSGVREIYFFVGATSSHGLAIDTGRPADKAFLKDVIVVDLTTPNAEGP
jgi:uncharacterized protein YkwD